MCRNIDTDGCTLEQLSNNAGGNAITPNMCLQLLPCDDNATPPPTPEHQQTGAPTGAPTDEGATRAPTSAPTTQGGGDPSGPCNASVMPM